MDRVQRIIDHRSFPAVAVTLVYLASVVTYALVSRRYLFPNLFPDEMIYGKLSQSFAAGHGLDWRGSTWGVPPLWPIILSVAWHFGSIPQAYGTAKVLGAALASTAVFPTWLLARTLVGPRRALIAAALSVMGTWMIVTVFVITENLAYPLAAASLASLVVALRDTRVRWLGLSVAFGLVAAAARTQMLSLVVVAVVAIAIDVLRQPRAAWGDRIRAWPRALVIGLGVGVIALLLLFILKPGFTNYDVLAHHASVGGVAKTAGRHAATAILAFAVIPVIAVFALMARLANWRDNDVAGPLLATTLAAVAVFLLVTARFEVWATGAMPVERYTMYLAPLACVALVVAPGRISRLGGLIAAVIVLAILLAAPKTFNEIEQPALFGFHHRLDAVSFFKEHVHLAVVLVSIPFAIAGVYCLTSRRHPRAGLIAAGLMTAALMIVPAWTYHRYWGDFHAEARAQAGPPQYDWVDKHVDGPAALLAIGKGEPNSGNPDLYTDFFNEQLKDVYTTADASEHQCQVALKPGGYFKFARGQCPKWPRYLVMVDRGVRTTLWNSRLLAATNGHGRLVKIPAGTPRVLAVVKPPCTVDGCDGALQVGAYLDQPANVVVTFGASKSPHRVQVGNEIRDLPAGKANTIEFPLQKGDQGVRLPVDWATPDGPAVESVTLNTGGETVRVY